MVLEIHMDVKQVIKIIYIEEYILKKKKEEEKKIKLYYTTEDNKPKFSQTIIIDFSNITARNRLIIFSNERC